MAFSRLSVWSETVWPLGIENLTMVNVVAHSSHHTLGEETLPVASEQSAAIPVKIWRPGNYAAADSWHSKR